MGQNGPRVRRRTGKIREVNDLSFFDLLTLAIKFLGGLGIFFFGMSTMSSALEQMAGEKLQKTLEAMTGNIFKAVAAGALVTAIIQSSTGTTVMVVGFVNAGIMTLQQAVGIIMGANIGTTITAQLLSLDSGSSAGSLLAILKPSTLCYILVAIGAITLTFSKKKKLQTVCQILIGVGLLFVGMTTMEGAVSRLNELPAFQQAFTALKNPVLGIIVGAVVTAILHSSAASIGILQAAAATGAVSYAAALPIIMGQNIGTCCTSIVSSLGGNKNAKRTAMIHFYFNLIGSVLFITAIYGINALIGFSFWEEPVTKSGIANFHTLFNITVTLVLLPFRKQLVSLAERTIGAHQEEPQEKLLALLDRRFYDTPSVALEQCHKVIRGMGELALDNVRMVIRGIVDHEAFDAQAFESNEEFIDTCEARVNTYLLGLKDSDLSDNSKRAYTEILHAVGEFEQIGDYAENLYEQYNLIVDSEITFSDEAICEIGMMSNAAEEMITLTIESFEKSDSTYSPCLEALEEVIDILKETLKEKHIKRLQAGQCTVKNGIPFLDIIHNLEKIADHCSNIGIYVSMYADSANAFDVHEYRRVAEEAAQNHSQQWLTYYEERYLNMILMNQYAEASQQLESRQ